MWMHNGGLGGWRYIKRRLAERLADKWYLGVKGGTDSEWAFALFLDTLERMGHDPNSAPKKGFGPAVLRKAMLKTIAHINDLIAQIPESTIHNENVDTRSLLNFCVSDGHSIICTRYINSSTDDAASLYYSTGTQWATRHQPGNDENYQMSRRDRGADVVLVASEPLTFERGKCFWALASECVSRILICACAENWINVPTNSILTIHDQTAFVQDIRDQFSDKDPWQRRSAGFVHSKGLVANEKTATASAPPSPDVVVSESKESSEPATQKAHLGPTIPFSMMRSITPQISRTATPEISSNYSAPPRPERATVSFVCHPSNPDMRSVKACPENKASSQANPPAQGNIKKKRMSLSDLPSLPGQSTADAGPPTPVSPGERVVSGFGDPAKIARFFPELTLSP